MKDIPDMKVRYTLLYSDSDGESHFADKVTETHTTNFAPPAPALNLSEYVSTKRFAFLVLPKGWHGDLHPAPSRQFMIVISGEGETTASDGESRRFKTGDVLLLEDTHGKGHISRSVNGATVIAVVQLDP
jgi:quercetin dioxygenase-like cupin family protein